MFLVITMEMDIDHSVASISMCVRVCVFKFFSETTGPTEAKYHVEPPWDRGGKFIQMI